MEGTGICKKPLMCLETASEPSKCSVTCSLPGPRRSLASGPRVQGSQGLTTASSQAGAVQPLAPRLPPARRPELGGRGPILVPSPGQEQRAGREAPAAGGEDRGSHDCEAGGRGHRGRGDAQEEQWGAESGVARRPGPWGAADMVPSTA